MAAVLPASAQSDSVLAPTQQAQQAAQSANRILFLVVVSGADLDCLEDPKPTGPTYTRDSLRNLLQLLGCKPRLAYKVMLAVFQAVDQAVTTARQQRISRKTFQVHPHRNGKVYVSLTRADFMSLVSTCAAEYSYKISPSSEELKVACSLRERRRCVVVLLCGTSGSGKSTLASILAGRLGITTVVSTDSIRHMLRSFISKESSPLLWASTYQAGEHLDKSGNGNEVSSEAERALCGYKAQCELLCEHLELLIAGCEARTQSLICEGVHLNISTVAKLMARHPSVLPFLVYIPSEAKHVERMAVRAKYMTLDPNKNRYVRYMGNIRLIQEYLVRKADKYNVPRVDNSNVDRSVGIIHLTVMSCLRRMARGEPVLDPATGRTSMLAAEYAAVLDHLQGEKDRLAAATAAAAGAGSSSSSSALQHQVDAGCATGQQEAGNVSSGGSRLASFDAASSSPAALVRVTGHEQQQQAGVLLQPPSATGPSASPAPLQVEQGSQLPAPLCKDASGSCEAGEMLQQDGSISRNRGPLVLAAAAVPALAAVGTRADTPAAAITPAVYSESSVAANGPAPRSSNSTTSAVAGVLEKPAGQSKLDNSSEVSVSELSQQDPCGAEAPDLSSTTLCGGAGSISSKCAAAAPGISSSARLPEAQSATPAAAAQMYAAVPSGAQQQKLQEGQQLELVADGGVTPQAGQEIISTMAGADKVSHQQRQQQQRRQQPEQQQQLPGHDSQAEPLAVSAVAGAESAAAHLVQGSSNDTNDLPRLQQPPGFSSSSSGGSSGRPSDDSAAGACPSISTENAGSTNTSAALTNAPDAGADVGRAVAAGGSGRRFEEAKQLWQGHMHVQQQQEGDVDDQVSSGEELDGLGELGSSDNEGERCLQEYGSMCESTTCDEHDDYDEHDFMGASGLRAWNGGMARALWPSYSHVYAPTLVSSNGAAVPAAFAGSGRGSASAQGAVPTSNSSASSTSRLNGQSAVFAGSAAAAGLLRLSGSGGPGSGPSGVGVGHTAYAAGAGLPTVYEVQQDSLHALVDVLQQENGTAAAAPGVAVGAGSTQSPIRSGAVRGMQGRYIRRSRSSSGIGGSLQYSARHRVGTAAGAGVGMARQWSGGVEARSTGQECQAAPEPSSAANAAAEGQCTSP